MKSNINTSPLRTFSKIPTTWDGRPNTINYHTLAEAEHYMDGWRDVVVPTITDTQRLGALIVSGEMVTYQVIDLTDSEIKANFESQIEAKKAEILQIKVVEQTLDSFQAITDEAEAFEVKEVFPAWNEDFNYLTVPINYKCTRVLPDGNGGFELGLFFLIQPHTPALGDVTYLPENAPALWSRVLIGPGGIEIWSEPIGGDGKYPYIDINTGLPYRVWHNGLLYENNHPAPNLNVWEPGVFGWTLIPQ